MRARPNAYTTKGDIDKLLSQRGFVGSFDEAIRTLRKRIALCEQYYPWPALIASFEQDIERLEAAKAQS